MATKKVKAPSRTAPNPLETFKDLGHGVKDSATNDVIKAGAGDFFKQLLDFSLLSDSASQSEEQPSHDKSEKVEIFSASKLQKSKEAPTSKKSAERQPQRAEAAIEYHRDIHKSREKASKMEVRDINQRMQEIMVELRKLVNSSKNLQMQFVEVAVEQTTPDPGEYHVNFFEWMLSVVRLARQKVEDSNAWLSTVKSKSKKAGYWGMFKKHGTTFGLSNERVVATQTG